MVRQQAGGGGASATLEVTMNAHQQMVALLQRCPLTSKERHDLTPKTEKTQASQGNFLDGNIRAALTRYIGIWENCLKMQAMVWSFFGLMTVLACKFSYKSLKPEI